MTTVVKIGGSLLDWPELGPRLRAWFNTLPAERVLLVPGGGSTTEAIRLYDRVHCLGEEACHWLALATLTVNARMLSRLLDVPVVGDIREGQTGVFLLDLERFARADEIHSEHVPHCWNATSDAFALRVARVAMANELVLLKSVDIPAGMSWAEANRRGFVDDVFVRMLDNDKDGLKIRAVNIRSSQAQG